MKVARSLRHRIARAFILLAVVLAGFFSLVSYISVEVIEAQVIDAHLEKMADKLIGHYVAKEIFELPPEVSFFANEEIPAELRMVAPGIHEMILGGHEMQALIRMEGGNRYAIVQDMDEFEHTEFIIFSALGAGFIASLLLAVVLGITTARHIVAPVSALADAVGHHARPEELPSLDADDEIGVLARAFAKRTDELEQFLMRERLFTGDVSHELRTPLTVMLGAAEVLMAQLADRPTQLAVAERVHRVATEMTERVGALLLLSRSPELLDALHIMLNPLIQSEVDRCRSLLIGKPVHCRLESVEEVWVEGRPELIGIIVGNLLRNACRHTDEGKILVRLATNQLLIEDDGHGIPESVQARLFERFVRDSEGSPEGTGLGLSIVKRLVEHIGWEIRYESPEKGGSRFIISFPPFLPP
ncbi:MAG TPA: HAMP domain-containing sensor histidine kinase [Burkholderiaceae bacterium]|jgi:signal transduction histidine kinase|nr:HAMP domain-containing sensor histidine kinase [Burkholderiaceae bacterium]